MILFQSDDYQIDLSAFDLTLNEESNIYINNMIKSYSFPFTVPLTHDVVTLILGAPYTPDLKITSSTKKGLLIIDGRYFDGTLSLEDTLGELAELKVTYGEEELPVYSTQLKDLPWPLHIPLTSQALAGAYIDKSWPEVSHNFPMIYRPKIKTENDYEDFDLFVNNHDGTDFIQNQEAVVNNATVYRNRNVLSPCAYILEILRFGFRQSGKKVRGQVLEDERIKKIVYIPEDYIEKFKGSVFTDFQFDFPESDQDRVVDNLGGLEAGIFIETIKVGQYSRNFTPDNIGTYELKFNLNFDPVTASYFSLKVYQVNPLNQDETGLFYAFSRRNRVSISEEIQIDITSANQFHPIHIEMELTYRSESISDLNSFEYSYRDGRLNELIGSYHLGQFVPDMNFGEFVNLMKNWLNLEIRFNEDYVYIDFVEQVLDNYAMADHSHLEIPLPKRTPNTDRVFRLTYSDNTSVLIDSSGQIYSDIEKDEKDIVDIKMGVQMAIVESNFDIASAVYPEKEAITFALYDGLKFNRNVARNEVLGFSGKIEDVYDAFWQKWLAIRTNNTTIRDKFMAHQSEMIAIRSKVYKYNKILLPQTIRKKRKLQEYWEIEMEAESI